MRYRIWHTAVMALLIGTQGSLWTAEAQASGLFDWLSRCGSDPEPQIVCYPMTTVYPTSACDCEPSPCCQSPDPCCPPMAAYPTSAIALATDGFVLGVSTSDGTAADVLSDELEEDPGDVVPASGVRRSRDRLPRDSHEAVHDVHVAAGAQTMWLL